MEHQMFSYGMVMPAPGVPADRTHCHRCRRAVATDYADTVAVQLPLPARREQRVTLPVAYFPELGWCYFALYHAKCLPPVLYHRFSGSLPESRSTSPVSLKPSSTRGTVDPLFGIRL